MSFCWYCYWGWSVPVADIYEKYLPLAGFSAMHFGPAHIVWEDENFERDSVQWCLDHFDEDRNPDHDPASLAYVRASLEELLALDDAVLAPAPDDGWDDPAAHPPLVPCRRTTGYPPTQEASTR